MDQPITSKGQEPALPKRGKRWPNKGADLEVPCDSDENQTVKGPPNLPPNYPLQWRARQASYDDSEDLKATSVRRATRDQFCNAFGVGAFSRS